MTLVITATVTAPDGTVSSGSVTVDVTESSPGEQA